MYVLSQLYLTTTGGQLATTMPVINKLRVAGPKKRFTTSQGPCCVHLPIPPTLLTGPQTLESPYSSTTPRMLRLSPVASYTRR